MNSAIFGPRNLEQFVQYLANENSPRFREECAADAVGVPH